MGNECSSKHRQLLACVLFGMGVALSPLQAGAQPSAADKETARSLMNQGDTARDEQDYRAALKAYEAADAIMRVPTTGLAVARMHEKLGQLLEARDKALAVARIPAGATEPAAFTTARNEAEQLADAI